MSLKKKISKVKNKYFSQNRTISEPNELWEFDVKYKYIHGEERFCFILIIDVFVRYVVNYHIRLSCTGKRLVVGAKHGHLEEQDRYKPIDNNKE